MKFTNTIKTNKKTKRQTLKHKHVYVFGYGSIVNTKSLEKTIGQVSEQPIQAIMKQTAGYKRVWSCMKSKFGTFSYLNVIKHQQPDPINGVLIRVKMSQLRKLSRREVHYQIKPVSIKHFDFMHHDIPKDSRIYVFSDVTSKENKSNCFLMQSYIDVVMEGFLQYGKQFKEDFENYTMRHITKRNILQDKRFPIYKNYDFK